MEKKKIKNYPFWTRLTSCGMAVLFFYVQVAYGVIEPSSKLWEERRKAAEELKRGKHKGIPNSNQTGSSSEENQILLAKVPSPESDKGLVAQLPSLELNVLSQQVPQKLGSDILGLGSQRENLQSQDARLQSEIKWLETIPASFANLKELYLPSQWKPQDLMVIHIQDVHENYEAQKNIARIIQALKKPEIQSSLQSASPNQQVQLVVGLEGAKGSFAFDSYRSLPEKEHVKKIAEYFLKESLISGAEYVGMTLETKNSKESPILFWGVENERLYLEHVRAFKDSVPQEKEAKKIVLDLQNSLNLLKTKILNPDLKELDQNMTLHHKGQIKLSQYLKVLTQDGIPSDSEMIRKFMSALNLEETLNYEQVEKERRALTTSLVESLPKTELKNLVSSSLSYRLGNISYGAFYQYLKDLCQAYGVNLEKYPEMDRYIRYVLIADKIKSEVLFREVENLEKRKIQSFIVTAQEKEIVELSKDLVLMEKMVGYRFSPEDWKEYLSRKNEIVDVSHRIKKLENYSGKTGSFGKTGISMVNPEIVVDPLIAGKKKKQKSSEGEESGVRSALVKALKPFEKFNEAAIKRDKALVENLLHKVREKRSLQIGNLALLVSGGFHTEGMTDLLRQKQIAYAVLTPRLGKVEGVGTDYLEIFRRDKTPLEKLFTGERITLKSEMGTASSSINETLPIVGLINRSLINLYAMLTIFSAAKSVTNLTPEQKEEIVESLEMSFSKQFRTVDKVNIDANIQTAGDGRKVEGVAAGIEIFGKINDQRSDVYFWSELFEKNSRKKKISDSLDPEIQPEEMVLDDFVNRLYPTQPGLTNQVLNALSDTLKSAFDRARNTFSNIDTLLVGVRTPTPQIPQKGEVVQFADKKAERAKRAERINKLKAASIPDAILRWLLNKIFKNEKSLLYVFIYGFFTGILIPLGETHALAWALTVVFGGNVFLAAAVIAFVFPILHTDLWTFKGYEGGKFSWKEFAYRFTLRFIGGGVFTLLLALPNGFEISFALHMLWNMASVIGEITGIWKLLPFAVTSQLPITILAPRGKVETERMVPPIPIKLPLSIGARSIKSAKRTRNEKNQDSYFVEKLNSGIQIAAVFDGMGGKFAGERASAAARDAIQSELRKITGQESEEELIKLLEQAMLLSVKAVRKELKKIEGGTTATVAIILPQIDGSSRILIANAGDSRAYLRGADVGFEPLTVDNVAPRTAQIIRQSELSKQPERKNQEFLSSVSGYSHLDEESEKLFNERHFVRNELSSMNKHVPVIIVAKAPKGSRLLLTSDGIHDNLTDMEIKDILDQMTDDALAPQKIAEKLIASSQRRAEDGLNLRGNPDDMTAIVMDLGGVAAVSQEYAVLDSLRKETVRKAETEGEVKLSLKTNRMTSPGMIYSGPMILTLNNEKNKRSAELRIYHYKDLPEDRQVLVQELYDKGAEYFIVDITRYNPREGFVGLKEGESLSLDKDSKTLISKLPVLASFFDFKEDEVKAGKIGKITLRKVKGKDLIIIENLDELQNGLGFEMIVRQGERRISNFKLALRNFQVDLKYIYLAKIFNVERKFYPLLNMLKDLRSSEVYKLHRSFAIPTIENLSLMLFSETLKNIYWTAHFSDPTGASNLIWLATTALLMSYHLVIPAIYLTLKFFWRLISGRIAFKDIEREFNRIFAEEYPREELSLFVLSQRLVFGGFFVTAPLIFFPLGDGPFQTSGPFFSLVMHMFLNNLFFVLHQRGLATEMVLKPLDALTPPPGKGSKTGSGKLKGKVTEPYTPADLLQGLFYFILYPAGYQYMQYRRNEALHILKRMKRKIWEIRQLHLEAKELLDKEIAARYLSDYENRIDTLERFVQIDVETIIEEGETTQSVDGEEIKTKATPKYVDKLLKPVKEGLSLIEEDLNQTLDYMRSLMNLVDADGELLETNLLPLQKKAMEFAMRMKWKMLVFAKPSMGDEIYGTTLSSVQRMIKAKPLALSSDTILKGNYGWVGSKVEFKDWDLRDPKKDLTMEAWVTNIGLAGEIPILMRMQPKDDQDYMQIYGFHVYEVEIFDPVDLVWVSLEKVREVWSEKDQRIKAEWEKFVMKDAPKLKVKAREPVVVKGKKFRKQQKRVVQKKPVELFRDFLKDRTRLQRPIAETLGFQWFGMAVLPVLLTTFFGVDPELAKNIGIAWATAGFTLFHFASKIVQWIIKAEKNGWTRKDAVDFAILLVVSALFTLPFRFLDQVSSSLITIGLHSFYNSTILWARAQVEKLSSLRKPIPGLIKFISSLPLAQIAAPPLPSVGVKVGRLKDALISEQNGEEFHRQIARMMHENEMETLYSLVGDVDSISLMNNFLGRPVIGNANGHSQSPDMLFTNMELSAFQELRIIMANEAVKLGAEIIYSGSGGDEFNIVFKGDSIYVSRQMKELALRLKNHFTHRYSAFTLKTDALTQSQIEELKKVGIPFTLGRNGSGLTLLMDRKGISDKELKDSLKKFLAIGYEALTYEDVEPGFFTVSMGAASAKDTLDTILQETGEKRSDWIDENGYVREDRLEELLVWNGRFANDLLKGAKDTGRNNVLVAKNINELRTGVAIYGKPVTPAKLKETRDNLAARKRGEIKEGIDNLTGHSTLDGLKDRMHEYSEEKGQEVAHVYVFGFLNYNGKAPAERAYHSLQEEKKMGYFKGNQVISAISETISEGIGDKEQGIVALGRVGPDTIIVTSEQDIRGPPGSESHDGAIKSIFSKIRKQVENISEKERELLGIVYDIPTEEIEKLKDPEILKEIEPQFRDLFLYQGRFGIINIIQHILEVLSPLEIDELKDVLELNTHDADETRVMVVKFKAENISKLYKLYRKAQDKLKEKAGKEMRARREIMHAQVEKERRKSEEITRALPSTPKPSGTIATQLSKLSDLLMRAVSYFIVRITRSTTELDNQIEASQRNIARNAIRTIGEALSSDMRSLRSSNVNELKSRLEKLMNIRKNNSLFKSEESLKEARKQSIDQTVSMLLEDFERISKLEQVAGSEEKRKQAAQLIISIFHLLLLQDEADLRLPYVPHSIKHSLNVRREVENIISRSPGVRKALDDSYGNIGQSLALLSAWLHDIGYGILTQAMEEANLIAQNNGVSGYKAGKGYHTDLGVTLADVPLTGGVIGPTLVSQLDDLFGLSNMQPNGEGSSNALEDLKLVIKDHGADHEEHVKDGPLGSGVHKFRAASMEHDILNFLARLADNLDAEAHKRLYAYHNNPFFIALLRKMAEQGKAAVDEIKRNFLAGQQTAITSYALYLQITQALSEAEALKKSQDHFDFILNNIESFDESNFPHFAGMIKSQRVLERDGKLVVQVVLNDSNRLIPQEVQDYQLVRMQKAYKSLSFNGEEIVVEKVYSEKSRKENEQENKNKSYIEELTLLKERQSDENQKRILDAIIRYLDQNPTADLVEGHEGEPLLFENGETIVSIKEEGVLPVYILVEGKALVTGRQGTEQEFTLRSGDLFGEMAHITGKRTANIYAQGVVGAYRIPGEKFRELFMDPEFLVAYAEVVAARKKSQPLLQTSRKIEVLTTRSLDLVGKGMLQWLANPLRFALSKLGLRFSDRVFENVIMPIIEELIFTGVPLLAFALTGPIGLIISRSIFVFLHIFGQPDMSLQQKLTIPFVVSIVSVVSYFVMPGIMEFFQLSTKEFDLAAIISGAIAGHIAGNFFVDWLKLSSKGKIVLGKATLPLGQSQSKTVSDSTLSLNIAKQIMQDLRVHGFRFSGKNFNLKEKRLEHILEQLEKKRNNWYWNNLNYENKLLIARRIAGAIDLIADMVSSNAGNLNLSKDAKIIAYGSFLWGEEKTPPTDLDLLVIDPSATGSIKKFALDKSSLRTLKEKMDKGERVAPIVHGRIGSPSKVGVMNKVKDMDVEAGSEDENLFNVPLSAFGSGVLIWGEWEEGILGEPSYLHYLVHVVNLLHSSLTHLNLGNRRKVLRRILEALTVLHHVIQKERDKGTLNDLEYFGLETLSKQMYTESQKTNVWAYSIEGIPATINENFSKDLVDILEGLPIDLVITNTLSVLNMLLPTLGYKYAETERWDSSLSDSIEKEIRGLIEKAVILVKEPDALSWLAIEQGKSSKSSLTRIDTYVWGGKFYDLLSFFGLVKDVKKKEWIEQKFARWWESPEFMWISLPFNQMGRERFLAKHENDTPEKLEVRRAGIEKIVEATQKAFVAGVIGGLIVALFFVIPFFSAQVVDLNVLLRFSWKVVGAIFVAGLVPSYITNVWQHGKFNLQNPFAPLTAGTAVFQERLNIVTRSPQMSGDQKEGGRDVPLGIVQFVDEKDEAEEAELVGRMAQDQAKFSSGWEAAVSQYREGRSQGSEVSEVKGKGAYSELDTVLDKLIEKYSSILMIGSMALAGIGLIVAFFNVWIGVPLLALGSGITVGIMMKSFDLKAEKDRLAKKEALRKGIEKKQKELQSLYGSNPLIAQILSNAKAIGYKFTDDFELRLLRGARVVRNTIVDEKGNIIGNVISQDGKLIPAFKAAKQARGVSRNEWSKGEIIHALAINMAQKGWDKKYIDELYQSTINDEGEIINKEGVKIGTFQYKNGRFIPFIFGRYAPPLKTDSLIKKVLAAKGQTSKLALVPGAWGAVWSFLPQDYRFFGFRRLSTGGFLEDIFIILAGVVILINTGLMPVVPPADFLSYSHVVLSLIINPLIIYGGLFLGHLLFGAVDPKTKKVVWDLEKIFAATQTARSPLVAIPIIHLILLFTSGPLSILAVLVTVFVSAVYHGNKNLGIEEQDELDRKARKKSLTKFVQGTDQQARERNWEESRKILDIYIDSAYLQSLPPEFRSMHLAEIKRVVTSIANIRILGMEKAIAPDEVGEFMGQILRIFWSIELRILSDHQGLEIALELLRKIAEDAVKVKKNLNLKDGLLLHFTEKISEDPLVLTSLKARENPIESFNSYLRLLNKNNPYSNSLWHGYYTAAGKDKESERQALLQAISAIHQVDPLLKPEHVARILNFVDEHPRLLKDNPHKLCYEALRGIAITMRYLTGGEIGSISYGPEEIIQNFLYRIAGLVPSGVRDRTSDGWAEIETEATYPNFLAMVELSQAVPSASLRDSIRSPVVQTLVLQADPQKILIAQELRDQARLELKLVNDFIEHLSGYLDLNLNPFDLEENKEDILQELNQERIMKLVQTVARLRGSFNYDEMFILLTLVYAPSLKSLGVRKVFNTLEKVAQEKEAQEKEAQGLGIMINLRAKADLHLVRRLFERLIKEELAKENSAVSQAGAAPLGTPSKAVSKPVLGNAIGKFIELQASEKPMIIAGVDDQEMIGLIEILVELGNTDHYEADLLPVLELIKVDSRFMDLNPREGFEVLREIAIKKRDLVRDGKLILEKKGARETKELLVNKFNRWIGEWKKERDEEKQKAKQGPKQDRIRSVTFEPAAKRAAFAQPKVKDPLDTIARTLLNPKSRYFNSQIADLVKSEESPEAKVSSLKNIIQPYIAPILSLKGDINSLLDVEKLNYAEEVINIVNLVSIITLRSRGSKSVLDALSELKKIGEALQKAIKEGNQTFSALKLKDFPIPNKNLRASLNLWRLYEAVIDKNYPSTSVLVQATQPKTYKAVENFFETFGVQVPKEWWVTSTFFSGFLESNQTLPAMLSSNALDRFIQTHNPTAEQRAWLETTLNFMKVSTLVGLGVGLSFSAHAFGFSGLDAIGKIILTASSSAYLFHVASHSLRNVQQRFGDTMAIGITAILVGLFSAGAGHAITLTGSEVIGSGLMAAGWPVVVVVSAILVIASILGPGRKPEAVPVIASEADSLVPEGGYPLPLVDNLPFQEIGEGAIDQEAPGSGEKEGSYKIVFISDAKAIADQFNKVWFTERVGEGVGLRELMNMLDALKSGKPSMVRLIGKNIEQNANLKKFLVDPLADLVLHLHLEDEVVRKDQYIEQLKMQLSKAAAMHALKGLMPEAAELELINAFNSLMDSMERGKIFQHLSINSRTAQNHILIVDIAKAIHDFERQTHTKLPITVHTVSDIFSTFLSRLNLDKRLFAVPAAAAEKIKTPTTGSLKRGLATGTLPETYYEGRKFFKDKFGWENAPNAVINIFFAGAYESLKSFRAFKLFQEHQAKLNLTPFQQIQLGITFLFVSAVMIGTAIGLPFGLDFLNSGGTLKHIGGDLAGSLLEIVTYALGVRLSYAPESQGKVFDLVKRLFPVLAFPMIFIGAIVHGLFNLLAIIINVVMDEVQLVIDFYKRESTLDNEYKKVEAKAKLKHPNLIQPLSQIEEEYDALLNNNQNPDKRRLFLRSLKVLALAAALGAASAEAITPAKSIDLSSLPTVIGHLTAQELAVQIASLEDYRKLLDEAKNQEEKDSFEVEVIRLLMHGGEAEYLGLNLDGVNISFNDLYAAIEQTFETYKISRKAALKIWNLGKKRAEINSTSKLLSMDEIEQLPNIPSDKNKIPGELFYGSGLSANGYVHLANKIARIQIEEGKKKRAHFLLVETREELEVLNVHGISPALLAFKGVHIIVREEVEVLKKVKGSSIDLDLLFKVIHKLDKEVGSLDIYTEKMVFKKGKRKDLQIRILKIVSQTQVIEITSDLELFAKAKQLLSRQQ